jgi:hypothetical protein
MDTKLSFLKIKINLLCKESIHFSLVLLSCFIPSYSTIREVKKQTIISFQWRLYFLHSLSVSLIDSCRQSWVQICWYRRNRKNQMDGWMDNKQKTVKVLYFLHRCLVVNGTVVFMINDLFHYLHRSTHDDVVITESWDFGVSGFSEKSQNLVHCMTEHR